MKKSLLGLLIVALISALVSVGFASGVDDIDLSVFSLDELKILQSRIGVEIDSRQAGSADVLYAGAYEAGDNIDEGGYLVTCTATEGSYDTCCLDIFYSPDAYKNSDYSNGEYHYLSVGETYYVYLEEGMVLYFYRGSGTIVPSQEIATESPVLYTGAYVVGRDIEEGTYVITCTGLTGDNTSCCLDFFYTETAYRQSDYSNGEYHYLDLGESYSVNLQEGMVLYFYRGVGNIQKQ